MPEPQTDAASSPPAGGGTPPAPPATGEPRPGPDPADPGPPIPVQLGDLLLGDLGHPRVDARLLSAILVRGGRVGEWLRARGVGPDDVEDAFPGTGW